MRLIANLPSQVPKLFFSKTLQNTGIVFSGNIIASIFSLMTVLLLSRHLGPETFGIFSLVGSVIFLMVGLTDFGIATGLSKFISPLKDKSSKKAVSFFRTVFWSEALLGFTAIFFGLIFLDPISYWLGGSNIKGPLILGLIAAGVLSFNAYTQSVLQALQRFRTIALFSVFSPLFKFLLFVTFLLFGYLSLWNALLINLYTALMVLLIGFLIIPKYFVSKINLKEDLMSAKELFSFTKWLAISYVLNALASRLDILILSHFRSSTEVGHYALAFQLSSGLPLLLASVSTVLIPKVSALKTHYQLREYLLKSVRSSLFIIPLALIGALVTPFVIKVLFGAKYIGSIPILQILLLSYSLTLIINPVSYVMYVLDKQHMLTLMNIITLVSLLTLQLFLIPYFGGIGAALALLFNTVIGIFILVSLFIILHWQGKIRI